MTLVFFGHFFCHVTGHILSSTSSKLDVPLRFVHVGVDICFIFFYVKKQMNLAGGSAPNNVLIPKNVPLYFFISTWNVVEFT